MSDGYLRTVGEVYPRSYARYLLLERLGAGGMSEVDLARQAVDDGSFVRFSVIKRIRPDYATDDAFVRMFKDEARITSELHHANIGTVYDFGKVGDEYYLALEYVPGVDLRFLVNTLRDRGQRVPVRIALKVIVCVLDALGYAHDKKDTFGRPMNIIHRDVNPRNVMVSIRGEVKLIDFGVAKASDRLERTRTDHVKGKFTYMAPEQLTGSPIDHRSDLYATALVLHELLAGISPFFGLNQVQVLHRMVHGDLPPLPDLPELKDERPLRRVLDKALAQDAADRYPTAAAFADALRGVAEPIGGLPTNDQLATFLAAVDPDLTSRLQRKMEEYARLDAASVAGLETVEIVRDGTGGGLNLALTSRTSGSSAGRRATPTPASGSRSAVSLSDPRGAAMDTIIDDGTMAGQAVRPPAPDPRRDPRPAQVPRRSSSWLAGSLVAVSFASAIAAASAVAVVILVVWALFGRGDAEATIAPIRQPEAGLPRLAADPVEAPVAPTPDRPDPAPAPRRPVRDPAVRDPVPTPEPVVLGEPGIVPPEPALVPGARPPPVAVPEGVVAADPGAVPVPDPALVQPVVEPAPPPIPAPAPAAAPAPVPAAVEDVGYLNVSSVDRGVEVRVDGVPVGVTPLVRWRSAVGTHDVRVTGYSCAPSTVAVRRNQVSVVTCK